MIHSLHLEQSGRDGGHKAPVTGTVEVTAAIERIRVDLLGASSYSQMPQNAPIP